MRKCIVSSYLNGWANFDGIRYGVTYPNLTLLYIFNTMRPNNMFNWYYWTQIFKSKIILCYDHLISEDIILNKNNVPVTYMA